GRACRHRRTQGGRHRRPACDQYRHRAPQAGRGAGGSRRGARAARVLRPGVGSFCRVTWFSSVKVLNKIKKGFYADSVALMRIARELQRDGMEASLMIGTPSNKALLKESGLLTKDGTSARPDDLIIAVRGRKPEEA